MTNSEEASATYTINIPGKVATPAFSPAAGTYTTAQNVTISCETDDAEIYYTTDGSAPSKDNGTKYTSAINVSETTTIRAIAVKTGMTNSEEASATYTINIQDPDDVDDPDIPDDAPEGLWIRGLEDSYTYTGSAIKPSVKIYDGKRLLTENKDYTIYFKNNTNVASKDDKKNPPTITIKGKGNYNSQETETFTIVARDIGDTDITVSQIPSAAYNKNKNYTPVPAITFNKKKLAVNKDFKVSYYKDEECTGNTVTPKEGGKYYAKVTGIGNFTGSKVLPFEIAKTDEIPVSKLTVAKIPDQQYTGRDIEPELIVKNGSTPLRAGQDYNVSYRNNKEIGAASAVITGSGDTYVGTRTLPFSIVGTSLKKVTLGGFKASVPYVDGSPIEQAFTLSHKVNGTTKNLRVIAEQAYEELDPESEERLDYDCTVEYSDNAEIGTATMILTGINGYTDQVIKTFKITGTAISGAKVEGFRDSFEYDGSEKKQTALSLTYKNKPLAENTDYTVAYENNTDTGTATMIITGKGAYFGTVRKTFKITGGTSISKAAITGLVSSYGYTGEEIKQTGMTLICSGKALTEGTDYTAAYEKNVNAGTAAVIITGKGAYYGTVKKTFKIAAYDLSTDNGNITVTFDQESYPYAKSGVKPEPEVRFKGTLLEKGRDYTVSYANNTVVKDENADKAPSVKITGKGNFTKFTTKPFSIVKKDLSGLVLKTGNAVYKAADGNWKTTVSVEEADGKKLSANKDYIIRFTRDAEGNTAIDNKARLNAGDTVYITVTPAADSSYTGELKGSYKICKYDISKLNASIEPKSYTGRSVMLNKADITWKSGNTEVNDVEFEIDETSYKNNVNKGAATVEVNGTGNTAGTKKLTFTIGSRGIVWWWRNLFN